jgi:hypothetical protein
MPAWAQPYLWLAWPLLVLLTVLFLFVTLRQAPAKVGPPSRKLVCAYLQEVAAEPLRTLADEVLGRAEFIPRAVTAQEKCGLFLRFAAAYRPGGAHAETEAGGPARPEPLEEVLVREKRLVLLGEPGMGKTTSMRHLAQVMAQQALVSSGDIPIYMELKYYAGEPELETLLARRVDDVMKHCKLTLGYDEAERTRVMRAWLADKNTRFLLLLDGLNEVAPAHRVSALDALKGLLSYPHRVLVSCREQDYNESLREYALAFALQGLQGNEIWDYLCVRLGNKGEVLFYDEIFPDMKMWTLVANPLMLWLVGEVARADPKARLPANRGQLFHVFVKTMPGLRRKEGVPMPDVPQDVVEAVLRALAFAMQEQHSLPPPDLGKVRDCDLPKVACRLEDVLAMGKAWRFLRSDGQHGEPVEFLHPLFQEYFAADELRGRLERKRDYATVLGDRPFTGEWDEVTVMLAGIHDDPTGLVKWLGKEAMARQTGRATLLAHRCWKTSDAVGDAGARKVVADALIQALGDPDEWVRREAMWFLGEIGDPRAVGPLIQALHDPDAMVCKEAAEALGSIGDPRAVELLIQALGDPDEWVRRWVAEALWKRAATIEHCRS